MAAAVDLVVSASAVVAAGSVVAALPAVGEGKGNALGA